jgi:hypothetical protein
MVACPYCNAFVPVPPGTANGRRLTCPRCGEDFAFLAGDGVTGASPTDHSFSPSPSPFTAEPPAPAPPDSDTLRSKAQLLFRALLVMGGVLVVVGGAYVNSLVANGSTFDVATFASVAGTLVALFAALGGAAFLWLWFFRVRRSNRATALFVLANMATLALLTLGGALATQGYRRHIDAGLPARPKRSPLPEETVPLGPPTVAPARLAALAYLPPGTDLVAGVHVAELRDDPARRKLFDEPLKLGGTEVRLADLPAKIGVAADELDHFVVGMRSEELLSPVLVARTVHPYDPAKVRQALNARALPAQTAGRTLYQVTPPKANLTALLWCADERTLVLGLARESLEKANMPAEGKGEPLTPEVRDVLRKRIGPVGPLWAAGHVGDWGKTAAGLALLRLPEEWQRRIGTVHAFGVWAVPEVKSVTVNAAARCNDEKSAAALKKWLAGRAKNADALTLSQDGNWLSAQYRADADAVRGLFAP